MTTVDLDYLIDHAEVYDGESVEPRNVSVGVAGGRIVHVGPRPTAASAGEVVSGAGLILSPGFIDTHASTGLGYMLPAAADNKLFQGVTTGLYEATGSGDG